jgi:hypothetical protein
MFSISATSENQMASASVPLSPHQQAGAKKIQDRHPLLLPINILKKEEFLCLVLLKTISNFIMLVGNLFKTSFLYFLCGLLLLENLFRGIREKSLQDLGLMNWQ